ncbi:NmrA family NAD(P)-binding protein [Salinimicrobium terrae]|uniref:NmrA family NAD(P)-binding protein n=1 Tax=Salinimicrobium terrae TaxID=470866 RepID=UPI00040E022F|nr:NmrA family NAD(P)-binding protein [Salinimicrobium terrae]
MSNILITGATGNIGSEVIRYLFEQNTQNRIIAGVRNIDRAKRIFQKYPQLDYVPFDFEDPETFDNALTGIDRVFLLRPPHLSNVDKHFRPLINLMLKKGILEIVFLSVQGAEKSKVIPHNKMERLIIENGLNYIFLRPSYFMQNLTTTLLDDIQQKREIILPAGDAKFNWIDIDNIAEVGAIVLDNFQNYKNRILEITGKENLNFKEISSIMNNNLNHPISYRNVNPLKFFRVKKREGMPTGMILVMIMLHFLPRFQKEPPISNVYEQLTGRKPTKLEDFIEREKGLFEKS